MWKLYKHLNYDHLYIPLTSRKGKFQPQTNIFSRNNKPFSIKPTFVWVNIFAKKKKKINFAGLRSRYQWLANKYKLLICTVHSTVCSIQSNAQYR